MPEVKAGWKVVRVVGGSYYSMARHVKPKQEYVVGTETRRRDGWGSLGVFDSKFWALFLLGRCKLRVFLLGRWSICAGYEYKLFQCSYQESRNRCFYRPGERGLTSALYNYAGHALGYRYANVITLARGAQ